MKKIIFALLMGSAVLVAPSCKKDDDSNNGGGTTNPPTLVGNWNLTEYNVDASSTVDFMGVEAQFTITAKKVAGAGTLNFESNNLLAGNGIIVLETTVLATAFGVPLFTDTDTDDLDLDEEFTGTPYEIVAGNKVKMTLEGEERTFDYVISGQTATLTSTFTITDNDFGDEPLLINVEFKLAK